MRFSRVFLFSYKLTNRIAPYRYGFHVKKQSTDSVDCPVLKPGVSAESVPVYIGKACLYLISQVSPLLRN